MVRSSAFRYFIGIEKAFRGLGIKDVAAFKPEGGRNS
jgi:hypothetical protein